MLGHLTNSEFRETLVTVLDMIDGKRPEIGSRIDESVAKIIFKIDFLDTRSEILASHVSKEITPTINGIG